MIRRYNFSVGIRFLDEYLSVKIDKNGTKSIRDLSTSDNVGPDMKRKVIKLLSDPFRTK